MTIATRVRRIDDDTLAVLSSGSVVGNIFTITSGQLDRKRYQAVNDILERLGGKWSRKERGHVFPHDPTERLETVLLNGSIEDVSHMGFFPTPVALARELVALAAIDGDMICLEPSAGTGRIVAPLVEVVGPENVYCVEIDRERARALSESYPLSIVVCGDFLSIPPVCLYDRVVMNPPFALRQDIAHVERAYALLKPGGRLVSVMAAGVAFRQDRKTQDFRSLVEHYRGRIAPNDDEAFRESGTLVRTVTVVLDKR